MGGFGIFSEAQRRRLARSLMLFEGYEITGDEAAGIFEDFDSAASSLDAGGRRAARGIVDAFSYMQAPAFRRARLDLRLYSTINRLLAFEEALAPGKLRASDGYIPCVSHPIRPATEADLAPCFQALSGLGGDSFKKDAASVFCRLCALQPFYDGNKRSTSMLCNVALARKGLALLCIPPEKYPAFSDLLALCYQGRPGLADFLAAECMDE